MAITRRDFLKGSAAASALAFMPPVFTRAVASAVQEQPGHPAPLGQRTLVVVQMAGGNDGLNTEVPANDPHYYALRGSFGIPQEQVLPLDGEVGLHPNMTGMKALWDQGILAVVEGVGYPNPSYSHFESMDIWQTAQVGEVPTEGWLGKYLDGLQQDSAGFRALAVGTEEPLALWGNKMQVATVESVSTYLLAGDPRDPAGLAARTAALEHMYAASTGALPFGALLDNTLMAAQESVKALASANARYQPAVTYPSTGLASSLRLLAEVIDAGLGLLVGHVVIGSFDTHADQADRQPALLQELSDAIAAFMQDLRAHGHDENVVLMTWSEFGRRAIPNASGGTDHGSAAPLFITGTPVRGGRYGQFPSLTDLDANNLKFTTDFRSVYASVLQGWLGAPADLILGQQFEQLPLWKT